MFGRILDEDMDMVALAVAGDKDAVHRLANHREVAFEPINRRIVKNLAAIFGDKNKVADQFCDRVSFPAIL